MLGSVLRKINHLRCKAWDLAHGVDTSGEIPLSSYDFESANKVAGLEYHSHHPRILRDTLQALNIRHEDYTFIDFGCGKGRVLLVASEFPFQKIVGIEFAPPLAEVAQQNVKTYRSHSRRCDDFAILCADATTYTLPKGPAVLYFYSPFTGGVMEQVVENIEASLQRHPRDLLVLFSGILIMRDRAFGNRPQYQRLRREQYFDLYQHIDLESAQS
jgi:SAM-dependent methyltransferase